MFLAFRSAGAKDWHSNLTIALDHGGVQHRLQFHHIFPKAVPTKAGVIPREADISNLAFIGKKANRVISDKPPKEYLAFFTAKSGEDGFSVQEIPLDQDLLNTPTYKKFLEVRRERIANRLNMFIAGRRPECSEQ